MSFIPLEVIPTRGVSLTVVLYTVFGFVMILVAALRRSRSNEEFFADGHGRYFRTSGRVVLITSLLAFALYITLIFLLLWS